MFIFYFIVLQFVISPIPGTDCQKQTSKILCYSINDCYWLNHKKACESLVQYNNAINPQYQQTTPSSSSDSIQNNGVVVTDTSVASLVATVISNPKNPNRMKKRLTSYTQQANQNNNNNNSGFTISGGMSADNTPIEEIEEVETKEIEVEIQEPEESETPNNNGGVRIPVFNPYIVPYTPSESKTKNHKANNNGLQEYVPQYTTYTMNDLNKAGIETPTNNNNNQQNEAVGIPQPPASNACEDQRSIHQCYHTPLVCWWDAPNKVCKIYPPVVCPEEKKKVAPTPFTPPSTSNTKPQTTINNNNNNNFQQTPPRNNNNNNVPNVPITYYEPDPYVGYYDNEYQGPPRVNSRIPATGRRPRVEREIETELEPAEMETEPGLTLPCGEQTTQANCLTARPPDVLCYWTQENICEEAEECEDFPDESSCAGRNFMNNIICEFVGGECAEGAGPKVLRLTSTLLSNNIEKQTDFGGLIFLGCIFLILFSSSSVFWLFKKL